MTLDDDVPMGRCCSQCDIDFDGEHGFPVLCSICWDESEVDEFDRLPKATLDELPDDDEG